MKQHVRVQQFRTAADGGRQAAHGSHLAVEFEKLELLLDGNAP